MCILQQFSIKFCQGGLGSGVTDPVLFRAIRAILISVVYNKPSLIQLAPFQIGKSGGVEVSPPSDT